MSMRVWKLQDFVAHSGRVHCARLGEKSGQVLATGGDDKRVNIWKVGKPHAMMSLAGHSSAVECLVFDKQEEVLVVGCAGGSMQIWNLEYRKMAGTLTGHRTACNSVEFHPYGEFFASGSADTNLKIWDLRQKSCIQTYKGHSGSITSIRFSPHGRWVATGGQDNQVKLWDLTAGKLMRDLDSHKGPITSLAFHPKEYLLATGSVDRTMKLWSLENFKNVGSTDITSSSVQAVKFYAEEQAVMAASTDSLKLFATDSLSSPFDTIDVDWRGLQDMRLCLPEEKLIGISTEGSQLGIWVADLKRLEAGAVRPTGGSYARPNARSSSASANGSYSAGKQQPPRYSNEEVSRIEVSEKPPQRAPRSPKIIPRPESNNAREKPRSSSGANYYEINGHDRGTSSPKASANTAPRPHSPPPLAEITLDPAREQDFLDKKRDDPRIRMHEQMPHRGSISPKAPDNNSAMAFGDLGPDQAHLDRKRDDTRNRAQEQIPPRNSTSPKAVSDCSSAIAFGEIAQGPSPSLEQAPKSYTPARSGFEERSPKSPVTRQAPQPSAVEASADQVQQLALQHPQMMGVLQRRLTQVRRAKELWAQGNLGTLSTGLQFPQDHALVCDFARAVMREKLVSGLNFDACQTLLPIMQDLMGSKYDDFAVTGRQFTELLSSLKRT